MKKRKLSIDERLLAALDGRPVDDVLFDQGLRRALFLEQYSTGQAREVVSLLNTQVFPDLLDKLEARLRRIDDRGTDIGPEVTARLKEMAQELRGILSAGVAQAKTQLKGDLQDLSVTQAEWHAKVLGATVPIDFAFKSPNVPILRALAWRRPFAGGTLDQWWGDLEQRAARGIERQITLGLAQGETVPQIVQRLRGTRANGFSDGVFEGTRSDAEAIVRTSVGSVSNNAAIETFKMNSDVLQGWRWAATLDPKTCLICGSMDGQVFDLEDESAPAPPAHPRCRCKAVPVVKPFKGYGFDSSKVPDGARAAFGGPVSAKRTWEDWIAGSGKSHALDVLGPGRMKLWEDGRISLSDLVSQRDRILTLDQLKKL